MNFGRPGSVYVFVTFVPAAGGRRRRRLLPALSVLSVLAAVLLAGGCGAGAHPHAGGGPGERPEHSGHPPGHSEQPSGTAPGSAAVPARPMTVEQVAASVGCQAKFTMMVTDYRQATCAADGASLVILDFATARGQRDWLDNAQPYGGFYLVGERWALSGNSLDYISGLQGRLGGTVETQQH